MAAKTKLTLHKYTEKQIEMILQKVKSYKVNVGVSEVQKAL